DTGIAGPTVDVVAIAIVDADEAEESRIDELAGDAERVLAVGADARGRCRLVEGLSHGAGRSRKTDDESTVGRRDEIGGDVAGELMEDARREKRLPDDVRRLDGLADAQAQASDLAFNVGRLNDTRDRQRGRAGAGEVVDGRPRIDEAARRLDEPALAEIEVITGRGRHRVTVRADRLVEGRP